MGNNDLNKSENILVKVDVNNLIYIDPNSVVNTDNQVEPRGVQHENLVMYVNLEADIVPRTILATPDAQNKQGRLISIARGNFNFLRNQNGKDFDTSWTESFVPESSTNAAINNAASVLSGQFQNIKQQNNDSTAQSFGIESINIHIRGFGIPTVTINFTDVRGKTLFESPKDSPYRAFFHLPWPIFYLTVKGYYGKAIRYRLHMVSFTSKFNESNGNFDITTTFVGSTYAYLADIPLNGILNAPYMYAIEKEEERSNNQGVVTKRISKSSKGYSILKNVYDELKSKNLIDRNFPVKTLREVITIAETLDNILEREIFDQVANPKVFSGIKEVSDNINNFKQQIRAWSAKYLSTETKTIDGVECRFLVKSEEKQLTSVTDKNKSGTLEHILSVNQEKLKNNKLFIESYMNKTNVDFKKTTFDLISQLQKIEKYIKQDSGRYAIAIKTIENSINGIEKSFNSQKQKVQDIVERKMNEIIKDPKKGFGFDPTIRNIFAVILANADVYIRLLKDVHTRAFEQGEKRKNIIRGLTDETPKQNAIYPWPEIKKPSPDGTQKILAYPGDLDLVETLQSNDVDLWPEVEFLEDYLNVGTKKSDNLGEKEQGVNKINYIFDDNISEKNVKKISQFLSLQVGTPYTNKSISGILYEIYERAVSVCTTEDLNTLSISELSKIEFENIKESFGEDEDIIKSLKLVFPKEGRLTYRQELENYMRGVSQFERYPYFLDKLPSTRYLNDVYLRPYQITSYVGDNINVDRSSDYKETSQFIKNYKPKEYRKSVYPYNSDEFLHNIGRTTFNFETFGNNLVINTIDGFISSPIQPTAWVKPNFTSNIFSQKIKVGNSNTNILNTPYFHNQLFYDFKRNYNTGKYAGSAYLLLNSLPFYDIHDTINFGTTSILMSSLFKEVSATHFVPYHLILKWGSIYHRYKKFILDGEDILTGCLTGTTTTPVNGQEFFDNSSGTTFTINGTNNVTYSNKRNVGVHPFYDAVFHQVVNGYSTYNTTLGNADFSGRTSEFYYRERIKDNISYWTGFFDNSVNVTSNTFYTLLPSDGSNKSDFLDTNKNFDKDEQNNLKIIWDGNGEEIKKDDIFSGKTFSSHNQYVKSYEEKDFSISNNYLKVVDLIGVFEPQILDKFEEYFLQFSSKKENVQINFVTFPDVTDSKNHVHSIKYQNFQDLLKEIVTVPKDTTDGTDILSKINSIITKQKTKLETISGQILNSDNLLEIQLGNTKEVNYHVMEGFTEINPENSFTYNDYSITQETVTNLNFIKLYIGEDLDGNYLKFFRDNNVEISENNVLQFRPLIQMYAGGLKDNLFTTKQQFQKYILDNLLVTYDDRITRFLNQLFLSIQNENFKYRDNRRTLNITGGYNMSPVKLEMYNSFKSFNDKWASGNSIGLRNLLEEFLFLDKANKDIGNISYLSLNNLISLNDTKNYKLDLYSVCSMIIKDSGFDMRAMPSYVNFYGTNFNNKTRISPSYKVARDIFGTFLEVDYEESSPKIILQYIGNNSKHPDMSDISRDNYLYNDDSFYPGDVNRNPLIVTLPRIYDAENLDKSNKVVAFEVSVGDQNQGIFKSIQLDQTSIKNTSESFLVLENIARSESGAAAYQIDTGLFDYYRQASYQCEVTMMGNAMIQPTMYFYLKNIPLFKGTYWITDVSHSIRGNKIVTSFKGSRVPYSSLPNPKDSFVTSFRVLFDKITNKAINILKQSETDTNTNGEVVQSNQNFKTEKTITTNRGSSEIDMGPQNRAPNGEQVVLVSDVQNGIPFNGYNGEKYIQRVELNGNTFFRSQAVTMGGKTYTIDDNIEMSIINKVTTKTISGGSVENKIVWKDIKQSKNLFFSSKFDFNSIKADNIITQKTTFYNPIKNVTVVVEPVTDSSITPTNIKGAINVGPNKNGYGMGLSSELMKRLKLEDGDVVYFNIF